MRNIKITGLNSVIKDLKKMDMDSRKRQVRAVRNGVNKLRDGIRKVAPVKSGVLRKNIKSSVRTYAQRKGVGGAVVVDSPARYWIPVEFGHSKGFGGKPVPPKPFVYNTRDRMLPGILNDIEKDIDNVLTRHGAR